MENDETLYHRYVDGDDEGLNTLMERYGDSLTFYINGYLHELHEAENLMIEAFSYLIAKKPNIRDGGFRGYLYKAARNLALRQKTKSRLWQVSCFDDLEADAESQTFAEEVIQTEERNRILHLCMEQLSPDYREALYLVCGAGYGYGMKYVWENRGLRTACLFGLLCFVITYHAIYNLLVSVGGTLQYVAYLLPICTVACGWLGYLLSTRRK